MGDDARLRQKTGRVTAPDGLHLSRRQRVELVVHGSLVGLFAGAAIALYRFSLSHAEELLRFVTQEILGRGFGYLIWFAALALMCMVVGKLMLVEPFTQGSGIPQIDAEVAGHVNMPWKRVLPLKFVEGTLCALAGLSLGREGPSVLLGGMAGKGVSRALKNGRARERLLVTCGAAAGMSAAFHAPLSGVLFAIEEIHREFSASLVISVMSSTVVADFVSSHVLGVEPLIHFVAYKTLPHELYPYVLLIGVISGLFGMLHNRGMYWMQDKVFGRMSRYLPYARLALPFALAGVVAFSWPDLMCGGDAIIERILDVRDERAAILFALLVGKYLFTAICFGSGAPGGTLFPLVVMGCLLGALFGIGVMRLTGMPSVYEYSFITLGMAGMFSSVIQAPVTAVVLVFELTGSLEALLATTVVSIIAYVTVNLTNTEPFYEHLYGRLIGKSASGTAEDNPSGAKVIRSYVVGVGALVENEEIRNVSWPRNTLVISVHRANARLIAKGATQLHALDEIFVVMDESCEQETNTILHRLTEARE